MKIQLKNSLDSKHYKHNAGFSLIEVIVALAVFTIGILALNAMQTTSIRSNLTASDITLSSTWASDQAEIIFSMPYDDPALEDDGDGTNQDLNKDGTDDDGDNFGLDHNDVATADGWATSNDPDTRYTIAWNVAVDMPIENVKTVQIIVTRQDRGVAKSVIIRHMKALYL